jgi:hypothetical protein
MYFTLSHCIVSDPMASYSKTEEAHDELQTSQEPDLSDLYPSPTAWKSLLSALLIYRLAYYYTLTDGAVDEFKQIYSKLKHHLYVTFVQYVCRLVKHNEREPVELDYWHYKVPEQTGSPKIGITTESVKMFYNHFLEHKRSIKIGDVPVDVYDFGFDEFLCPSLGTKHVPYNGIHTNNEAVTEAISKWRWLQHEGIIPEWLWLLRTAVIWPVKPYYSFFLDSTSIFKSLYTSMHETEYRTFLRYCEMMLKHLACEITELPFWKIEAPGYGDHIVVTGATIQLFLKSFMINREYLTTYDYSKSMFTDNHVYFLPQNPITKYDPSQITYQYRELRSRFFWKTNLPVTDFRKKLVKTVQSLYRSIRDDLI